MTPEDWFIDRIEEYLDEDLPAGEREEMDRLIATDPACRAEIEEARRFRLLAREARPIPIPEELGERIRERVAREQPLVRGRVVTLNRLVAFAVAASVLFLLLNPIGPFEPETSLDSTPEESHIATVTARPPLLDLLADWLDQAKNVAPGDVDPLFREARELDLLARVRSRLTVTRGADRTYLLAAEDLLIQIENGISVDAFPLEAEMVAMARN